MSIEREGEGQEGGWSNGGSKGGYKGKGGSKVGKDQESSPRAGSRRVPNVVRAAARVQLAAVGHVEDPISPVTARGQSHALTNQDTGFLKNGGPHPQSWPDS